MKLLVLACLTASLTASFTAGFTAGSPGKLPGKLPASLPTELKKSSYARNTHFTIFDYVLPDFWPFVRVLVKEELPKSHEKWISNKWKQLSNIGDKALRVFERCGQESVEYQNEGFNWDLFLPFYDPESYSAELKACNYKDWLIININKWTQAHLTSCRSFRRNNSFEKRLAKWNKIYNRVLNCDILTTPSLTTTTPTTTTQPPSTTTPEPEPECGCYAQDEEIPIENDKCVLDLSQVSDVKGDWSFAFDLKINSLPTEATDPPYNSGIDWFAQIVTVLKDGAHGFPTELLGMGHYPDHFVKYTVKGSSHSPGIQFETNQWYKFTVTGSPADEEMCKQDLLVEGPGLRGWFSGQGYVDGLWAKSVTNWCLDLDKDSPLRVYTTKDVSNIRKFPIDGVVRNVVFTEKSNDRIAYTTIVSPCTEIEPPTTVAPEPPVTTPTELPEEPECGCYAPDEEIPIENDKCVMNLGSFPDTKGDWSFTFDFKINSLPAGPTDPRWFFYIFSVLMDYRDGREGPNRLTALQYFQSDNIAIDNTKGGMVSGNKLLEVNQWYKFTATGTPDGDRCQQRYIMEGPGLGRNYITGEGWVDDKWSIKTTNDCLVLEDGYPLKVYATRDLSDYWEGTPLDGVIRNLAFTNTATDTTMTNFCPTPPPECGCYAKDEEIEIENDKCVLALGTFPDLGGEWTFTLDFKLNSLPAEYTDPRWFFYMFSVEKDSDTAWYDQLLSLQYLQGSSNYPHTLLIEDPSDGMRIPSVLFEVGEWYKLTVTGSNEWNEDFTEELCQNRYFIEGPGLRAYFDGAGFDTYDCKILEEQYPLKVYATKDTTGREGIPMDGVIRNVAFTNTATDETMNTIC